jgi:hypothetical protein
MNKPRNNAHGLSVMLSASLPKSLEETRRAKELFDLMVVLIGGILSSSSTLVFGGHPTVTPLIHRIAKSIGSSTKPQIKLFQLNRFRRQAPEEVYDRSVFGEVAWVGLEKGDKGPLDLDLAKMRNAMVKASEAAIFIGGKTEAFSGRIPGIRDEYNRFIKQHLNGPVYLLGMLDGESLNIIKGLLERNMREPNSLSEDELKILHNSDNIDLVSSLILADIQRKASLR